MKKYNLYLWLTALVVLFASCSQDETDTLQTNESNRVSLTAELPDDFAQIGTRALPDAPGSHTLRCILEVWTTDPTPVLKHRQEQINLSSDHVEFNFTIDEGTYNCLFWADFIAESPGEDADATIGDVKYKHYADKYYATNTASGLKAISIITDSYAFNTDARDAFFGNYVLEKEAVAIVDEEIDALTRPFAKLTIKEKDAEKYADCNELTAKYNVPKTFNVSTGTATDSYEASYSAAPAVGFSDYTLFSDYIFTNATSTTLGSVALTFTSASGKTFQDVTIPAGIPLQRNFRTNASGSLITEKPAPTDGVKMTVTMNADWGGEDVEEDLTPKVWDGKSATAPAGYTDSPGTIDITSAAELAWLAQQCSNNKKNFKGYTFNLTTDIDLNKHEWTPIGISATYPFKGTFNGQNHTVSNLKCSTSDKAGLFGYLIEAKVSNVTVNGIINYNVTTEVSCYLGGIAGYASNSPIENCTNQCTITATGSAGAARVGGIVGGLASVLNGKRVTFTGNTNTGTITNDNTKSLGIAGGIIGSATAMSGGHITLTDNTYDSGTPANVCIGKCIMSGLGTITINGNTDAENDQPYPVPAP